MKSETIEIVDRGRGPQLSTTRITVMDIFYWLHRGYGWDHIQESMPTLTKGEFDVVMEFVNQHREELAEKDARIEERIQERITEQRARGFGPPDDSMTTEQWVTRFRQKIKRKQAEKNGEGNPD
jgi:uncharacterized protein (DUF433 family)